MYLIFLCFIHSCTSNKYEKNQKVGINSVPVNPAQDMKTLFYLRNISKLLPIITKLQ